MYSCRQHYFARSKRNRAVYSPKFQHLASTMAEQKRVMISSTARDLPEHREEVRDACLQQKMFPIMMEHLPASDADAIAASLKLVDEADVYALLLAHRYGYVPKENNPQQTSITEM